MVALGHGMGYVVLLLAYSLCARRLVLVEGEEVSEKSVAYWSISLDTECPSCGKDFDLIELDSFRESSVNPLDRTKDYEITCPHCEHEYLLDLEY